MYRHGLRVSEAISLRRDDLNLQQARIFVKRLKKGLSVEHPIAGDGLRAIKRYLATREDRLPCCSSQSEASSWSGPAPSTWSGGRRLLQGFLTCIPTPCATLRLLSGRQGHRSAYDPGLSWPSGSTPYGALHPRGRPRLRRAVEVGNLPSEVGLGGKLGRSAVAVTADIGCRVDTRRS